MALIHSLILLCGLAAAQQQSYIGSCFGGLNDTDAPATINECDAQDALNVEPNKTGSAVKKRKGYAQEGVLPITTAPVTGSHTWLTDIGEELTAVCNDVFCSKSTNGGEFSTFLTTATGPVSRWSFVDIDGDLYGANSSRDKVFIYTGATLVYSTAIPQGSILELTQDRLVAADQSAYPNRVCYSRSGFFSDFSVGTDDYSSWCDDMGSSGNRITGLKYDSGILYIFQTRSINACEIGNQYTSRCSILANYVGTKDPASIISTPQGIMFKGDDGHIWTIFSGVLEPKSKEINTIINSQPVGTSRNSTINDSISWDLGAKYPTGSWDSFTTPGSIFASSFTLIDSGTTSFVSGNLEAASTAAISGLAAGVHGKYVIENAGAENGNLSAWKYSGRLPLAQSGLESWDTKNTGTCGSGSAGSFTDGGTYIIRQTQCKTTVPTAHASRVDVINTSGASIYSSSRAYATAAANCEKFSFDVSTQTVGMQLRLFSLNYDGSYSTATSNAIFYATQTLNGTIDIGMGKLVTKVCGGLDCDCANASYYQTRMYFDFPDPWYLRASTFTSQHFDTSFATPTFGRFFANTTDDDNVEMSYAIQTATSSLGVWDTATSITDGGKITSTGKRFVRYKAYFDTSSSSHTIVLSSATLEYATTGYYITKCIETGPNISSWGLLACSESNAGGGSLSYAVSTGATCGATTITSFSTQTNNQNIWTDTGAAMKVRITSLLGSATDHAQVDACTVYWNEGTAVQPTWGIYDGENNRALWAITSGTATANNRLLRYDFINNKFLPWDISAAAPIIKNNNLYFGSSSLGTWYKYGDVDNDAGSAINSYWKTKDFVGGSPFQEKNFYSVSSILRNEQHGLINVDYTYGSGAAGSYEVSTNTDSTKGYIRNNHGLPLVSPETFVNLKYGNNVADSPWELDGFRIDFSVLPWRQITK